MILDRNDHDNYYYIFFSRVSCQDMTGLHQNGEVHDYMVRMIGIDGQRLWVFYHVDYQSM